MEKEKEAVRIWDIVPEVDYFPELDAYPIYEILPDNVVKENAGTKRRENVLVYNVTDASDEFKQEHADVIHELEVKDIKTIRVQRQAKNKGPERSGKIVTIFPVAGNIYSTLTKSEANALGSEYFKLVNTPEGINLVPVLSLKNGEQVELYLKVNATNMSPELLEKIAPEVQELASKENGLYEVKGDIRTTKEI